MLAGPHPRSLSLGGAPWARFPPAPRSGRGRSALMLAGRHPARSHSAARLGRASLRRLARAAGALLLCSRGATPLALTRRRALGALPSGASLGPRALCSYARGAPPRSLSLGGAPWARLPPAPRSGRGRSALMLAGRHPARSHSAARLGRASLRRLARAAG